MRHKALPLRSFAIIIAAIAAQTLSPFPADACGVDSDCALDDRVYRIAMPPVASDTPVGAIIFIHGYRGSASGVMLNTGLIEAVNGLGLALVAPEGRDGRWALPNHPGGRTPDELPFFDALRARLIDQHGIDPGRIIVSGFSSGGMVTWEIACNRGGDYLGFVPVAGTFWAPVPGACPSPPANLLHIHGRSDKVVPLEGRPIGGARQGSVPQAIEMYGRNGSFGQPRAFDRDGLDCTERRNPRGNFLDFCLHNGGHSFRSEYVTAGWKRLYER